METGRESEREAGGRGGHQAAGKCPFSGDAEGSSLLHMVISLLSRRMNVNLVCTQA